MIINKAIVITTSFVLIIASSVPVIASEKYDEPPVKSVEEISSTLTKAGYSKDTAEALEYEEMTDIYSALCNGDDVKINTCSMEVDNLDTLEELLRHDKEKMLKEAESEDALNNSIEEAEALLKKSNNELEKEYGLTRTEIKMIRKAEENAKVDLKEEEEKDFNTVASGTIASAKLTYTQAVKNNSTKTKPNYRVTLSYSWKKAYLLAPFTDVIVVGWGGGLNSKDEVGVARYYTYKNDLSWIKYKNTKAMGETALPNKGYKFSFPQLNDNSLDVAKTKSGSASLTVYQTKKKGYDTKIISNYCHRVLKANATVGISASGPSCSISIGKGYDHSPQKATNIGY